MKSSATVEYASMRQTLQLENQMTGDIIQLEGIALKALDRAVQVARAYQYFRIKKVDLQFKPFYDTFANPDPTQPSGSVPYLYWLINKGDVLDVADFNGLRDAGAKPIRFDEKTINVSFKPAILMFSSQSSATPTLNPSFNMSKVSPWLTTNDLAGTNGAVWTPSSLEHHGFTFGVQQDITGTPGFTYGVEITVHFDFKKPLNVENPSAENQKEVKMVSLYNHK